MARRHKSGERQPLDREHSSTPTQEDEADILEEVGAAPGDSGELAVPLERVREVGAVDAESVRENRRVQSIVNKKRANIPNVSFNTGDVTDTYDAILQVWPANTIDINVRRLTGTPTQHVIISRPRSGAELYAALSAFHGQHEEAEYEVTFKDNSRKEWRGRGKITLPDTRLPSQQGQPMGHFPYGAPPPGYAPVPQPYAQPGYPPQPQPQQPPPGVLPPQPIVMQAPPGPDMGSMLASFQQLFDMFRSMQPPAPAVAAPAFAPQYAVPLPPPPGSDMNAQMAWFQKALEIFQSVRPPEPVRSQPLPQAPPSQPQGGPNVAPPPGMMWAWIPNFGFALMPVGGAGPGPGLGGPSQRPFRPYPRDDHGNGGPPQYPGPREPPPRERTPKEQFQDAISVVRTAVEAVNDINTLLPNAMGVAAEAAAPTSDDDDGPVKVIDTGRGKFVLDKQNGGFRGWESFYANLPDLLKWGAEQREAIQKAHAEQQQQRQRPQQLPPGFVEVGPGYTPPPGFVAIPIDPQQPLPPPPSNMPPPIQPQPQPRQQAWGVPVVQEEE